MNFDDTPGSGDVSEMYAYISIDEAGNSGLCAGLSPIGPAPFIGVTLEHMKKWKPAVEKMRAELREKGSATRIRLARYVVEEFMD